MTDRVPVVFFMDSGLGGIPYMLWLKEKKPHWKIIYLADNAFFPYGSQSGSFLIERLSVLTQRIINLYSPDLGVIACNTASVTALDELRARFVLPFVGVVPAVKPAAEHIRIGIIGVLATEKTVKGEYLKALIRQFAPSQQVETRAASDLVNFVENRLFLADEAEIKTAMEPYIQLIIRQKWKALVLGCTHFILLKPWFKSWLPSDVIIIDSTEGVGQRILHLLPEDHPEPYQTRLNQSIFHVTAVKNIENIYQTVADKYQMILSPLEVNKT